MNDHRDAPTPPNRISEQLDGLSTQLALQVERAVQVYGPSPLLAELDETAAALKALATGDAQASEEDAAAPAHDLPAMQRLVEMEELSSRVARQIESTLGQLVTNAVTELEYGIPLLHAEPAALETGLKHLKDELKLGKESLRWMVADLRPPLLLADMGLGPSLSRYAGHFAEYSGLQIEANSIRDFSRRLPASMELAIFRIVQEALKNAHQHAEATIVTLSVDDTPPTLTFSVVDDGKGFGNVEPARGLGLIGMRQRARAIGGDLHILTQRGEGASVIVTVSPPEAQTASAG